MDDPMTCPECGERNHSVTFLSTEAKRLFHDCGHEAAGSIADVFAGREVAR